MGFASFLRDDTVEIGFEALQGILAVLATAFGIRIMLVRKSTLGVSRWDLVLSATVEGLVILWSWAVQKWSVCIPHTVLFLLLVVANITKSFIERKYPLDEQRMRASSYAMEELQKSRTGPGKSMAVCKGGVCIVPDLEGVSSLFFSERAAGQRGGG